MTGRVATGSFRGYTALLGTQRFILSRNLKTFISYEGNARCLMAFCRILERGTVEVGRRTYNALEKWAASGFNIKIGASPHFIALCILI
jgi:hypothetical protein